MFHRILFVAIAMTLPTLSLAQEKSVKKDAPDAAKASAPKPDGKADAKTEKAPAKPDNVVYAEALWKFITRSGADYKTWKAIDQAPEIAVGPIVGADCKIYANKDAQTNLKAPPYKSIIVIEHYAPDAKTKAPALAGVSVKYRPIAGYDAKSEDWYWAHYLPGGKHVECSIVARPFAKPGFVVYEKDGRLWVFRAGCKELGDYLKNGELAQHVVMPGVGPGGMTVRAPDKETVTEYVISRPGFITKIIKEQLWVLKPGTKEATDFAKNGPLAQHVTRPLAGPLSMTIRAADAATLDEYLHSKSGFVTVMEAGRLWIFRPGSKDLAEFKKNGELAKQVVQPGAGPGGMTLKSPDRETIIEYLTARDGFTTIYEKERLWVFRTGAETLWKFKKDGELAQHVVRPAAGPMGLTLKAPDGDTLDLYLKLASN